VSWNVEYTNEFGDWWRLLTEREQEDIDNRFYKRMIPVADRLYDEYIDELRKEGLIP